MRQKSLFFFIIVLAICCFSLPAWATNSIDTDDPAAIVSPQEDGITDDDSTTEQEIEAESYYKYSSTWTNTLIHEIVITNNSRSMAFNISVDIPLMDATTPIYSIMETEILSPQPDSITTDENGHRTAHYTIPYLYGNQSTTISMRYIIQTSTLSYTFDQANVKDEYSSEEMGSLINYLQPSNGVYSTDPAIIAFTEAAIGDITDPYQKARTIFAAVNRHLDYDTADVDQSATAVFERGTASCHGYTNLYLACLRAAGIPARQQSGYLYMPQEHTTSQYVDRINGRINLNTLAHTWVEFYLPELGWIVADPTFTYTYEDMNGELQKFVNWSYFANIGLDKRYIFFSEIPMTELDESNYQATGGNVSVEFNAYLMFGSHPASFNDIDGHWAQSAIAYCVSTGLFSGLNNTTFAPDQPMTRAMFITVIGRLYQELSGNAVIASGANEFTDVQSGSYYIQFLDWAYDNNIIEGYGDGRFGPNDNITRAQMAQIIANFVQYMGTNIDVYEGTSLTFSDSMDIPTWAYTAVSYCSYNGLITGMPGNLFSPNTTATRAQVATIMQRFANSFSE